MRTTPLPSAARRRPRMRPPERALLVIRCSFVEYGLGLPRNRPTGRRLLDGGGEFLVGGVELAPAGPEIVALPPGEVGAEVLDLGLDARPVGSQQPRRHAPLLPGEDGLVAVGRQRGLDELLTRVDVIHGPDEQPPRRLARFHPPGAFPAAGQGKVRPELAA